MVHAPKSPLQFPALFPIKIVGMASEGFAPRVLAIIQRHLPETTMASLSGKPSQSGKYLSITATLTVPSQTVLDSIYQDLTQEEQILFVL